MNKPEFVYTTYIETTAEKLWHALTDGDFTESYWFGHRVTSLARYLRHRTARHYRQADGDA